MAAFETFERNLAELKGDIVLEIVNVLQGKGYDGKSAAYGRGNDYRNYTVWANKYGNGVIVEREGRNETHIDNMSVDDALNALAAVLRAAPNR